MRALTTGKIILVITDVLKIRGKTPEILCRDRAESVVSEIRHYYFDITGITCHESRGRKVATLWQLWVLLSFLFFFFPPLNCRLAEDERERSRISRGILVNIPESIKGTRKARVDRFSGGQFFVTRLDTLRQTEEIVLLFPCSRDENWTGLVARLIASFLRFNLLSSGWTDTVCIFSTPSTTKFFSPGEKVF